MWEIIFLLSPYVIAFTIPLLITAIGGLICERSGVVNIGLEGLMIVGSFTSAFSIFFLYPLIGYSAVPVGIVIAALSGAIFSLLHAFASVSLNANQVISGTAINMIAASLTVYFSRFLTGSGSIRIVQGLSRSDIPILSKIPVIGRLFFTQTYITTWFILFILILTWYVIHKTPFGLRLRACGEHPHAADVAGINVRKLRYVAVIISGACAACGGAIILVTYSGEFNGSVAGLGFLSLAALIFGQWKPFGVLGATFFFGFTSTLANVSQVVPALAHIPGLLLKGFPYVATLIALMIFSKSSQAPKAAGQPFETN